MSTSSITRFDKYEHEVPSIRFGSFGGSTPSQNRQDARITSDYNLKPESDN